MAQVGGVENLKFANMGKKPEASQPLSTRKLINVIILGLCEIKQSKDQRSATILYYIRHKGLI